MLKFVYALFVGILIATFVGVGIDAFYESPEQPDYPEISTPNRVPEEWTEEEKQQQQKAQVEYQEASEKYREAINLYNRNVSIIAIIAAVIVLVGSLLLADAVDVIADGMILGGVLTLVYAIIRGFQADDPQFRFIVITIGLVIAIALGYLKFLKPMENTQTS